MAKCSVLSACLNPDHGPAAWGCAGVEGDLHFTDGTKVQRRYDVTHSEPLNGEAGELFLSLGDSL